MDTETKEIGQNIRAERKKKGLTQVIVAEKAGIAVNSLRLYEAGKRHPNLEQLRKIALAIGVPVSDLVGAGFWLSISEADKEAMFSEDPTKVYLLAAFSQLNEEGQSKALERVEELTEIPKYKK